MKRQLAGLLLFFAGLAGAAAQTTRAGNSGSSPYVSELRAETRRNLVRLSWVDSADARGPVYIFRSARPFDAALSPQAPPARVAYGMESYIDEIDGSGTFYYFVAASDDREKRHDIILPNINTITVTLTLSAGQQTDEAVEAEPLPELGISGIAARAEGDEVIVSYHSGGGPKNTILYRSLQPIKKPQDLLNAVIARSGMSSPFVDYPVPGLSWYYAVIFEDEVAGGSVNIYPDRNATSRPVSVTGDGVPPSTSGRVRAMPLPSMSVYNAVPGTDRLSDIPDPVPLHPETIQALDAMRKGPPTAPPAKTPRVFTRDLEIPAGGEDSALMRIVQEYFVKQDWRAAQDELLHYLSLPRSPGTEARARFYLGQTCYFSGKYREALIEFLFVRSFHPNEANVWIDATLAAMIR